ncbi:MAG: hypothetical protein EAZ16_09350 [Sphingobacteriales bacterium]|jgi:hypothetical protein|nr:MAG: hypothetical protein EAZ16_09350 [Sphingobacteriales bacterium]
MKKILVTMAFAAIVLAGNTSYAADKKDPGYIVKEAFKREFTQVKNVTWEVLSAEEGIYKASFVLNNESVQAYFSTTGDYIGTARTISLNQLPIMVIKELTKKYNTDMVEDVVEYSSGNDVYYYITTAANKGKLILKATGSGTITVHKTIK